MRPGLRDQREEIKAILKYTEEHGLNSTSEGEDEVMPMNLCRELSPMLEWKLLTGFNYDTLQKVVERALPFVLSGNTSSIKNNECIILALVWMRTGTGIPIIATMVGKSYQIVIRAIQKGIRALSQCFEPFVIYGSAPRLSELLTGEEKQSIPESALESRFIVGGKHIRGKRCGSFDTVKNYYSFKLNTVGYQFQCIVTHLGHCVHVTNAERAGTHDMTVYRNNRGMLLAGLDALGFTSPVILGDSGYKNAEFPELYAGWEANTTLNGRRLIVENYLVGWQKCLVLSKKSSLSDMNMSITISKHSVF